MKYLFNRWIFPFCGLIVFFFSSGPLKAQENFELTSGGWITLLAEPQGVDSNQPVGKLWILTEMDDLSQLIIERSLGTPDNFQRIDTVSFTSAYEDPGLEMNLTYFYRLRINRVTESGDSWSTSNMVRLTTVPVDNVPEAPSGLEAVAVTSGQINMAWDDNADNESYYVVVRKSGSDERRIGIFENATQFEDTGLLPETTYTYSIMAYNYKGYSVASNEVSLKTLPDTGGADLVPPGMDSITLIATPLSSSMTVWLFPLNRLHGVQSWVIERSIDSPDNFQVIDTMEISINSNPYPDQGVGLNTTYYYRLRLLGENSLFYSNTASATTFPVDTIPDAPVNLRAVTVTSIQVHLEWDDNDDEAFYTIHRKLGNVALIDANTPQNQTQYTDKELLPETTYTYYITAFNYKGHSLGSNEVTVTTLDATAGIYSIQDPAFSAWLHENLPGVMRDDSSSYLVIPKAAEIEELHIGKTDIKNLDGLQYFISLREFTSDSKIQRVPDLSQLSFLETFAATNANLSFAYQLSLQNLGMNSLSIENGKFSFIPNDQGGNPMRLYDTSNNEVAWLYELTTDADFKNNSLLDMHAQSVFRWYKDDQLIKEGKADSMDIAYFEREHIGYYSAKVTNPLFPGDTLIFDPVFVSINNRPFWWADSPVTGLTNNFGLAYPKSQYLNENVITPGDIIGVFYRDETGNLQTRTTGIWTGKTMIFSGVVLPGDLDGVDPKTGFEENEPLQFKLYDIGTLEEFDVAPEFAPPGEEWPLFYSFYPYDIEDIVDFYNDGLFHPIVFDSTQNTHLRWNWSVIVNWKIADGPWEPATGGPENHVVVVPGDVYSDIRGTSIENGDYLGFFFEDEAGELVCSDLAKWTGESLTLNPWGSNGSPKNGFTTGEPLRLKIWKNITGEEYFADIVIYNSNFDAGGLYVPNSLSILDSIVVATPCTSQSISLYPGWNLISIGIIPEDLSMSAVCAGIEPVIVKNAAGDILYAPQNGISTGEWNPKEGYQVFVLETTTLNICGSRVEDGAAIEIPFNTYPYFFPYWYSNSLSVTEVLGAIESHFDYAQSVEYDAVNGRFSAYNYIPGHIINPPIDNIGNMKPGIAYKLRMNSAATYTYEKGTGSRQGGISDHMALEQPEYFNRVAQGDGQNAVLVIPATSLPEEFQNGDEIAIVAGENSIAGAGVFNGVSLVITVWESQDMKYGDPLTLKVWKKELNREVETTVSFSSGSGRFEVNSLQVLSTLSLSNERLHSPVDISTYPNPVSDRLTIRFPNVQESLVSVKVYDLMGNQFINQEYLGRDVKGNEIVLNTSSLASGTYICRISYADQVFQNKLVVVK